VLRSRFLNINRKITALASGRLSPNLPRDVLVVGTQTNLLAFDVEKNSDLFYKDVPDGINAVAFGHIGSSENPLAIVGGNCSIQGFDFEGNELFWTVTGDRAPTRPPLHPRAQPLSLSPGGI
jgi:Bardet-Biedl syndrome 2 protein